MPLEPSVKTAKPSDIGDSVAIAHLFKPLDRPGELPGKTYKLKWPESDHAIYITLNDILDESGRIRPFEIFINSKNTEHYAWTVALMRMISAVFRRGGVPFCELGPCCCTTVSQERAAASCSRFLYAS